MYEVYAQTPHNQPIVLAVKRYGRIKGLLLAVVITNGNTLTKTFTARSIIIGGPLVVNDDPQITEVLMHEYRKRLPWYVIYSEIRPIYNMDSQRELLQSCDFDREGHYNIYLNVRKHESVLWEQLHKERKRNIQQAQKVGLVFKEVRIEEEIRQIIALIVKTYRRKGVPLSYEEIFLHANKHMPNNVHYFAAYHGDTMVAGQVRLGYKNLLYAWFAGSDEQYFKMRPNDFLMWNVICWAHRNGYKYFDFGGGGKQGVPYGVRDYKMKYGCEIEDYGRYIYTHRPLAYKAGKLGVKMLSFPTVTRRLSDSHHCKY